VIASRCTPHTVTSTLLQARLDAPGRIPDTRHISSAGEVWRWRRFEQFEHLQVQQRETLPSRRLPVQTLCCQPDWSVRSDHGFSMAWDSGARGGTQVDRFGYVKRAQHGTRRRSPLPGSARGQGRRRSMRHAVLRLPMRGHEGCGCPSVASRVRPAGRRLARCAQTRFGARRPVARPA